MMYDNVFYTKYSKDKIISANIILDILEEITKVQSVIDVGCGIGDWLSVVQSRGITDICGIDEHWINCAPLQINKTLILVQNLNDPIILNRKYDLAISLEVAEHLDIKSAPLFINSLVNLSDTVLFSAAIPSQGGRGHLNEQWPVYWHNLFKMHNFECVDIIRPRIWNNDQIPYWYRQNILLMIHSDKMKALRLTGISPLSLVHPLLFNR